MKLSLFFGAAFAAHNADIQSCMKQMVINEGSVMDRAMGGVACLERNGAEIKIGQCVLAFSKVSWSLYGIHWLSVSLRYGT